jgi:hypothetical protein
MKDPSKFCMSQLYIVPNDHRQDINIPIRLEKLFLEQGIALGCSFAPRRLESHPSDFLVITQVIRGPFVHDGPEMYEEVYDVERQPIEGVKEMHLKKNLGVYLSSNTSDSHDSPSFFQDSTIVVSRAIIPILISFTVKSVLTLITTV